MVKILKPKRNIPGLPAVIPSVFTPAGKRAYQQMYHYFREKSKSAG
jgi:hypothetical protein